MTVKKQTTAKPVKTLTKSKKTEDNKGVNYVRGGSICDPHAKGAHIIRGTRKPAVCRTTPGKDSRPRWRVAGS